MRRREFFGVAGAAVFASSAGCLSGISGSATVGELAPPWRREGQVYHPGHNFGMGIIGIKQHGELSVALSYSLPDRFWTISGTRRNRVAMEDKSNSIHLMASVWHTETETVFPVASGLRVTVERAGDSLTERALWPMLTQNMGFHYGDNIVIPEWGLHTVTVELGTTDLPRRGALRGSYEETGGLSFEFDIQLSKRNQLPRVRQQTRRGEHAAVQPMQMSRHPLSYAPQSTALPGRFLGEATSGDGVFAVSAVETADGSSLLVSPRTPFNRFVLPLMSVSARVERDGSTVFDGPVSPVIDPELQYHYRAPLESLEPGDLLTLTVDAPPQTARHIGYESAFLDMPPMTVAV